MQPSSSTRVAVLELLSWRHDLDGSSRNQRLQVPVELVMCQLARRAQLPVLSNEPVQLASGVCTTPARRVQISTLRHPYNPPLLRRFFAKSERSDKLARGTRGAAFVEMGRRRA